MIHLVFIHGVANRRGALGSEVNLVRRRQIFFETFCFENEEVEFYEPYWGQYGAAGEFQTIPRENGEPLAIGQSIVAGSDTLVESNDLLEAAKLDFAGIVNSLAITIVADDGSGQYESIADTLVRYALVYDKSPDHDASHPEWLFAPETIDDEAFVDRLVEEAAAYETVATLGIGDVIKSAAIKLGLRTVSVFGGSLEQYTRRFSPKIAMFLGDAMRYLKQAQARDAIRHEVLSSLVDAQRNKKPDDLLIVVGHSMGANILFDMLSDKDYLETAYMTNGYKPDIDAFLSVGTQLGLFFELGLFAEAPPVRPDGVQRWWHVYNRMDVLSFTAGNVIDGIDEFSVDTTANIFDAHEAYFTSIMLMRRLRIRLQEAGLLA